jgi:hypothetical protein
VRSFFVFPAVGRTEAFRRLQAVRVTTDLPLWVSVPGRTVLVWAELVEDLPAADFTSDDLVELERVAGFRPEWGIEIGISADFDHWRQRDLRTLTTWLLSEGGCATSIELDEFKTADEWRDHWAAE